MPTRKKAIEDQAIEDSFPVGGYVENTATTGIHRGRVGVVEGYTGSRKSVCVMLGGETHTRNFLPVHLRTTAEPEPEDEAERVVSSTAEEPEDEAEPVVSSTALGARVARGNVQRVNELIETLERAELFQVYWFLGEALARTTHGNRQPTVIRGRTRPSVARPLAPNVQSVSELIRDMEFTDLMEVYQYLGDALETEMDVNDYENENDTTSTG